MKKRPTTVPLPPVEQIEAWSHSEQLSIDQKIAILRFSQHLIEKKIAEMEENPSQKHTFAYFVIGLLACVILALAPFALSYVSPMASAVVTLLYVGFGMLRMPIAICNAAFGRWDLAKEKIL